MKYLFFVIHTNWTANFLPWWSQRIIGIESFISENKWQRHHFNYVYHLHLWCLYGKQINPIKDHLKMLKKFSFYNQYTEFNFCSVHWSYNKLQQWQNIEYYELDRIHKRNTYIFLTLHPQRTEEEARLGKTPRFQWHHSLNHPS